MQTEASVPATQPSAARAVRLGHGVIQCEGPRLPVFMVGQDIHLFRIGPLYDRFDGTLIADITDEMCAEMAHVFGVLHSEAVPVPIDWNHGTEKDVPPELGIALGRIVAMRHEPGVGLWGSPIYNSLGEKVVTDSGGALWTSPAFLLGSKYPGGADDPKVGAYSKSRGVRLGDCQILSVALTPTPRQDGTFAVLLSDKPPHIPAANRKDSRMDANTSRGAPQPPSPPVIPAAEGAPAAEPTKAAESPEEMSAMIAALQAELAAVKAENASLKASAEGMSESAKALSETRQQVTLLSQRVAKAEADAADERLARELDSYEARGLFAPASRSYFAELAKASRKLFNEGIARLEKNPEVPLGQVGHSARVEPVVEKTATQEFQGRVSLLLSEGKVPTKVDAINAVKAADPALYARAIRE